MFTDFFDEGICGIPQVAHLGTINKDSKEATKGFALEKQLPAGFLLMNVIAVASADMAGASNVTVGDATTEDAYGSALEVSKGKSKVNDLGLTAPKSAIVKVKTDAAISAGSIDIFATAIRLSV